MGWPRRGAAEDLKREGIAAVLTLTEAAPPEGAYEGLFVAHEPMLDFAAPSPEALERCVAFVRGRWAEGQAVVVHCFAGFGRTGTVLSAVLVSEGLLPSAAIEQVRALR